MRNNVIKGNMLMRRVEARQMGVWGRVSLGTSAFLVKSFLSLVVEVVKWL
jgi:hypothetical protein